MAAREDPLIGTTLGSYRIASQLGAGAMGAVYLAEHRFLQRKVAIKVLQPGVVERADLLERFFAEARATSQIEHPGIVQIFDCEVDAQGRPYIVMERLVGETLSARLAREGALPPAEAIALAWQACEALAAAHAKGIVHRDIKPDNMFLLATTPPTLKLVDFGIAKLAGDVRGSVRKTKTGIMLGTPLYMSPEQCRGTGEVDHRADLYSMGAVLFETLTGRPPFQLQGLAELIAAHLMDEPPLLKDLVPAVSDELAALVAWMLRKRPEDRPPSMAEVASRLAAMDTLSPPSRTPTPLFSPIPPTQPGTPRLSLPSPVVSGGATAVVEHAVNRTTFGSSLGERSTHVALAIVRRKGLIFGVTLGAALGVIAVALALKTRGHRVAMAEDLPSRAGPAATSSGPAAAAPSPAARRQLQANAPSPANVPSAHVASALPGSAPPDAQLAGGQPRRVVVGIETSPPGAQICLASDKRLLGVTPRSLELPADGKRRTIVVSMPGYRLAEVAVRADRDQRRSLRLTRLGPDDLEDAAPCR